MLIMEIDGQLTFEDSPLVVKFNKVIDYIRQAKFNEALDIMNEILKVNPDFPGLILSIKSLKFWQNRWLKISRYPKGEERTNMLINEWSEFEKFIGDDYSEAERVYIAIKNLIYKKILNNMIFTFQQSEIPNVDLLIRIGKIFIEVDEHKKAIETLEYARMFRKRDSYLLSLLGEAYSMAGNFDKAALFFKEAFLYDMSKIDLDMLKSEIISKIKDEIKDTNIDERLIVDWIPVYGVILNIFNVRRDLDYDEITKITQEADELEKDYNNMNFTDSHIEPKLINRYLWILDYYIFQSPNKEYKELYLKKLKDINTEIYNQYLNLVGRNK